MLIFNTWLWNEEDPRQRNILNSPQEKVFYHKECGKDHTKLPFPHTDHRSLQEQSLPLSPAGRV